jgi:pyruvate/2-oxoglutarate dehydrogenase complex dihydrolipoamide dehydrogenase (E3) component
MKKLDAIVIGTGQAGPFLAARLAGSGLKVAIIERKLFGGTCVNTGCIPTKTLIASARAAYLARRAADFGVMINGTVTVDMRKVKARKDDIAGRSNHEVPDWMKNLRDMHVLKAPAPSGLARKFWKQTKYLSMSVAEPLFRPCRASTASTI